LKLREVRPHHSASINIGLFVRKHIENETCRER
jgi:hypothetical protein